MKNLKDLKAAMQRIDAHGVEKVSRARKIRKNKGHIDVSLGFLWQTLFLYL